MILSSLLIVALLLVDLLVLPRLRRYHPERVAMLWTIALIVFAGCFAVYLGLTLGHKAGVEFTTGYLIELSLSIDNLFVFLLMFRSLNLTPKQQHHVLLWGIVGAIVLRAVFILVGVELLSRFVWIQYLFGAILILAALRLLRPHSKNQKPSALTRWISRRVVQQGELRQGQTENGQPSSEQNAKLAFSSLLIIILAVELTDLLFALDSIPAVLAVTRSPLIAWTSNAFAILGLRSLYFVLAKLLDRFHLLHYGLGLILTFVGLKMITEHWVAISPFTSLGVILAILALFVLLSLKRKPAASASSVPH